MDAPAASAPPKVASRQSGQAIATVRKARRLSQHELALQAAISVSLLRKIEQGTRPVTPAVHAALSNVLGPIPAEPRDVPVSERISYALPLLREVMDCYDMPGGPVTRPLPELSRAVATATALRLDSRYVELVAMLPNLLADLTSAALTWTGHEQEQSYGHLALAYRAADAIADKHGWQDMSARSIELTRWAAARSGDPALEMMATYVRAELFFTRTHSRAGLRVLDKAASQPPPGHSVADLATYGALHMRAAVLASQAGLPDEAADRMAEARAAARRVPDGVYHGTAFGPSSVHVHELAAAVESGDTARALQLAVGWQPPRALPAERRSHFYIEAASAFRWAGDPDQAITALWQARHAAPQHTRCNPAVSQNVQAIINGKRRPSSSLLQFAAWLGLA